METIRRTKIIDVLKREDYGATVNVKGWVRTRRGSKSVYFIALNDGSTINNVQVVADADKFADDLVKQVTTGACLSVTGELVESVGSGQAVEIQAREIVVLGTCGADYPMQKKGQSMEYMRQHAHMRLRTNTFGAVFRIRPTWPWPSTAISTTTASSISIRRLSRPATARGPGRCSK